MIFSVANKHACTLASGINPVMMHLAPSGCILLHLIITIIIIFLLYSLYYCTLETVTKWIYPARVIISSIFLRFCSLFPQCILKSTSHIYQVTFLYEVVGCLMIIDRKLLHYCCSKPWLFRFFRALITISCRYWCKKFNKIQNECNKWVEYDCPGPGCSKLG